MTKNSQDELARAYAILSSLRKSIDQIAKSDIEETYVHEFHSAIEKLIGIGVDVSEFRIPDSELAPVRTSIPVWRYGSESGDNASYSKEKYVKKQYFLMKIDEVLGYFEIITSPEPKKVGFRTNRD